MSDRATRATWDALRYDYVRLHALSAAAQEWGAGNLAHVRHMNRENAMKYKHGSWTKALSDPVDGPECRALTTAYIEVDELTARDNAAFYHPAERAAIALFLAPAPDPDAMLFKLDVIRAYALDGLEDDLPRPIMEVLAEDADRLQAGAAA